VDSSDYKLLSASQAGVGLGSNSGTYGSLTWSHEWTPRLQSTAFFQYGVRSVNQGSTQVVGSIGPSAGSGPDLSGSASATYLIGEGVTGTLQYIYQRQATAGAEADQTQNTVLLTVAKTF